MFTLPELPYGYDALEPFIDTETMHIHHDKHHATYVKNLNELLTGHEDLLNMDINEILKNFNKVPDDNRQKVINNAGGVANHNLFWEIMCSNDKFQMPNAKLKQAIEESFGSFEEFKEKFITVALNHFGSGWAWLVVNNGKLSVTDTTNQDSPITHNQQPILTLDVWEHAYYLKYKNVRADYINAWWNIINWNEVEKLYLEAS